MGGPRSWLCRLALFGFIFADNTISGRVLRAHCRSLQPALWHLSSGYPAIILFGVIPVLMAGAPLYDSILLYMTLYDSISLYMTLCDSVLLYITKIALYDSILTLYYSILLYTTLYSERAVEGIAVDLRAGWSLLRRGTDFEYIARSWA